MKLQIITPEKIIFDGEIESIIAPGVGGEFQLLKDHAPIVSALGKGKVRFSGSADAKVAEGFLEKSSDGKWTFEVDGGVLEMNNNQVILLAD